MEMFMSLRIKAKDMQLKAFIYNKHKNLLILHFRKYFGIN
jgi:hypothetical protein